MLDLWRPTGRLSYRKLKVLINQLPAESALATALRLDGEASDPSDHDPDTEQWSRSDLLLAAAVDAVRELNNRYEVVNFKGAKAGIDPIPRPGVGQGSPQRSSLSPSDTDWLFQHLQNMG